MKPLTCGHGRCAQPATWVIEAGDPTTGYWYTAPACNTHRRNIEHRATRHTQGQPAKTTPLQQTNQTTHQQQLTLDI